MPRSSIVKLDYGAHIPECHNLLYFSGKAEQKELNDNEKRLTKLFAEKIGEDFDLCVISYGAEKYLPLSGFAYEDNSDRILFAGNNEGLAEIIFEEAESKGHLIAFECKLIEQLEGKAEDLRKILVCEKNGACGKNSLCFECIFNREFSSDESNRIKIVLFENQEELLEQAEEFLETLHPPPKQNILAKMSNKKKVRALKSFVVYSDIDTELNLLIHSNLLTKIIPNWPRKSSSIVHKNPKTICELSVFMPLPAPEYNLASTFQLFIDQLVASVLGINIDLSIGESIVKQPVLFESTGTTLRNVIWMQESSKAVAPPNRITLFFNSYLLDPKEPQLPSPDALSELARNLLKFDRAVTEGEAFADLRRFWELERSQNRESIQAFFALACYVNKNVIPLIPTSPKTNESQEEFSCGSFSFDSAFGTSKLSDEIKLKFSNRDIEKIHDEIEKILFSIDSTHIDGFKKEVENGIFSNYASKQNWIKIIQRDNLSHYFRFLISSNKLSNAIWDKVNKFSHANPKLTKFTSRLSDIINRIYIPGLYRKYNSFIIIINDFIHQNPSLPQWFKERYNLYPRGD